MSVIGYSNLFMHFLQQFLLTFILVTELIKITSNITCGYTSGQKKFSPMFAVDVQSDAQQDSNNSSSVVQQKKIIWTITVCSVSPHVMFMPLPYMSLTSALPQIGLGYGSSGFSGEEVQTKFLLRFLGDLICQHFQECCCTIHLCF